LTTGRLDWLGVSGFVLYGLGVGALATYFLRGWGRVIFAITSIVVFVAIIAPINGSFMTNGPFPTFSDPNAPVDSLMFPSFPNLEQIYKSSEFFTLFPIFTLILAIGCHAQSIASELKAFLVSRQKARAIALPTMNTEFLNRPPAYMPDNVTLMDAVDRARTELLEGGHLDENMMTVTPDRTEILEILTNRAAAVDLDAQTGRISDIMGNTEIKRRQDEDK